jgi:RimJ/RimL family protein N-acetyltransferase
VQRSFTTERLVLRPWRLEDAPRLSALSRDPGFTQFTLAYRNPLDISACRTRICERLEAAKEGLGDWVVVRGRRIIGATILQSYLFEGDSEPVVEVGYRLEQASWGQGFASEAASRLVVYVLRELKRHRVVACIEPANLRSQAVARKLGMTFWRKDNFKGLQVDVFAVNG